MVIPFLKRGLSLACLHLSGKIDKRMDKLHICVNGVARTLAPSFKNLPAILSKLAAFTGFILFRRFSTIVSSTSEKVRDAVDVILFL